MGAALAVIGDIFDGWGGFLEVESLIVWRLGGLYMSGALLVVRVDDRGGYTVFVG